MNINNDELQTERAASDMKVLNDESPLLFQNKSLTQKSDKILTQSVATANSNKKNEM